MKSIGLFYSLLALIITSAGGVLAQSYVPIKEESKIDFSIYADKSKEPILEGCYNNVTGHITFIPSQPNKSKFDITINPSVNSANYKKQDAILKDLNSIKSMTNYPEVRFTSTHIAKGKKSNEYIMQGKLSTKGRIRNVSITFTAVPNRVHGYTFNGQTQIDHINYKTGKTANTMAQYANIKLLVICKAE